MEDISPELYLLAIASSPFNKQNFLTNMDVALIKRHEHPFLDYLVTLFNSGYESQFPVL